MEFFALFENIRRAMREAFKEKVKEKTMELFEEDLKKLEEFAKVVLNKIESNERTAVENRKRIKALEETVKAIEKKVG